MKLPGDDKLDDADDAGAARRRDLAGRILCSLIDARRRDISLLNAPELAVELADLLLAALEPRKTIY